MQTNLYPPSLFLEDGTEVRLLPLEKTGGKTLYVSADGRCFSYFRCVLRLVKPQADTSKTNRFNAHRKQKYLRMTSYGNILVHIAVAIVWIGPKPGDEFECDHLNGITTDNRVTNLQWVTPAENRKRAKYIRVLRQVCPLHAQTFQREDYLEWFKMPFEEFKSALTSGLGELVGPEQMMKESFYEKE